MPEQSEVSFAAYFNAFAAGYWRHWSALTAVRLHLQLRGTGRVDVYRTKADGSPIFVRGVVLERAGEHTVDLGRARQIAIRADPREHLAAAVVEHDERTVFDIALAQFGELAAQRCHRETLQPRVKRAALG